jgi:hypothetical protein
MFGTYVKMSDVDLKGLPDGTYSYCAKCKTWFGKEKRSPSQPCPDCGTSWGQATGIYEKKSGKGANVGAKKPKVRGLGAEYLIALLAILFLLAVACCNFWVIPTVQKGWRQSESALDAVGAGLLSLGALAAATVSLFVLLTVLLFLLLTVGASLFEAEEGTSGWSGTLESLGDHGRLVGTLLNALASLGALLLISVLFGRAPGLWELVVQILIALLLERAIVKHWDRYLDRLYTLLA